MRESASRSHALRKLHKRKSPDESGLPVLFLVPSYSAWGCKSAVGFDGECHQVRRDAWCATTLLRAATTGGAAGRSACRDLVQQADGGFVVAGRGGVGADARGVQADGGRAAARAGADGGGAHDAGGSAVSHGILLCRGLKVHPMADI